MGFLSRLTFGQQSPWSALPWIQQNPQLQPTQPPERETPAWAQFAQEMQAAPPVTPQPRTQTPRRPAPVSFTPQNAQPMTPTPGTELMAAPGQSQAQVRPPSFSERLGTWSESPLLQMGLSLLGNADNGGDWGAVGQDLRQYGQDRTQRQRQQNEDRRIAAADRRDETLFGWQGEDRTRQAQGRSAWEAAVARETDPVRQAELRAMGQEDYGDAINARDQRNFIASQSELDRAAQIRAAGIASQNRRDPRDSIQYRSDLARLGEMGQAAGFATQYVRPRLTRAREIITRLSQIGGMDNPLSANRRIQLSQLGQFGEEARGLLQELARIQTEFTVEDARALAPVSNTDFGRLMEINPNGNMTVDAAYRIIDGMEREVSRGISSYNAAAQWADRYGGLTGTLDEQGRTFEQTQFDAEQPGPGQAPPAPPPAIRRTDTLEPAAGLEDGTRATDLSTGRRFIVRNGQWRPVQRSAPPQAARGGRPGAF